jgi:peptide/nickel transport system substrate-binding protein
MSSAENSVDRMPMTRSAHHLNTSIDQPTTRSQANVILSAFTVIILLFTTTAGCLDDVTLPWDDEDDRKTNEFTYYTAAAPRTLDPAVAYDDVSLSIVNNLYDRLYTYQSETGDDLVPQIAKGKWIMDDEVTYRVHMQDDQKFASGRTITAYDVEYSITRVLKMDQAPSWMLRQILDESGIEFGDYNFDGIQDVKFTLNAPYSGFPHILAFSVCSIVDKQVVEANGGVVAGQENLWMKTNSAGSGPYKVSNWDVTSNKVSLSRNGNYRLGWGGKHLEKIVFKVEPSETIRMERIKGDNADMADIPISLLGNLTEETSIRVDIRDTMSVVFIGFNTDKAPFDDIHVRKAFSFAFNYNVMMASILEGKYGDRLHGPIPDNVDGYASNLANKFFYDPGSALDHFREAGYTVEDGKVTDFPDLTFHLPSNMSVMGRIMFQLKKDLAEVGIEVDIQYTTIAAYNTGLEQGAYPVFLAGWSADYADPDDFVYPLLHSESSNLSISNLARYMNGSVDELILDGKETTSPSDRKVIYRDIQNAVNGDVPYIWLYQPKAISVLKSDVTGFNRHPILGTNYYDVTITT